MFPSFVWLEHVRSAAVVQDIQAANLPVVTDGDGSVGCECHGIHTIADFERLVIDPLKQQMAACIENSKTHVPDGSSVDDYSAHGSIFLVRMGNRMVLVRALMSTAALSVAHARMQSVGVKS